MDAEKHESTIFTANAITRVTNEFTNTYGRRIRVRVCGLLFDNERILLVNHRLPDRAAWWAPPGGGVEFGEPLDHALQREFKEETGLQVTSGPFAFGCEYRDEELHAIELFFRVMHTGGTLTTGEDPELPLIADARFMNAAEWTSLADEHKHALLKLAGNVEQLQQLKGFYSI